MPAQLCYKLKLYRYLKVDGFEERVIRANFLPTKVNGFGVALGTFNNELYVKKYCSKNSKRKELIRWNSLLKNKLMN